LQGCTARATTRATPGRSAATPADASLFINRVGLTNRSGWLCAKTDASIDGGIAFRRKHTGTDDGLRAGSVRAVIDGRFSPKAFEASEDAEALAATLREEVVLAIQPAIQAAMKAVIGQLNSLGA
jgi:hypothetical protein